MTLFAGEFIFSGVKPVLRKTKKHPISKCVGGLKARGLRSDDLEDALRGIQRGLDEMKAAKVNPLAKFWIAFAPNTKFLFPNYE